MITYSWYVNFLPKLFVELEIYGFKGKNKTGVARNKIIFDFFFQLNFF